MPGAQSAGQQKTWSRDSLKHRQRQQITYLSNLPWQ